jgi:hypothetical protein
MPKGAQTTGWCMKLPSAIDEELVRRGYTAKLGPLSLSSMLATPAVF